VISVTCCHSHGLRAPRPERPETLREGSAGIDFPGELPDTVAFESRQHIGSPLAFHALGGRFHAPTLRKRNR